jgi:N6-adenosine-specific RNA methylase IME4
MEFHEVANIFPMMSDAELQELANDIKTHGLLEPIITWQEKILDGRNRYIACNLADVQPDFAEWKDGSDPVAFVISKNLKRRHLDESQRAMVGARLANMPQGARTDIEHSANLQNVSQSSASEMLNIGTRSIASAKTVMDDGIPSLVKLCDDGRAPVSIAARVAMLPKESQEDIVKRVESGRTLNQAAQDLRDESKRIAPFPKGKYQVIYADPPWQYDNSGFNESAENQYPTMPTDEICELPIESLCTDESILFLWATNPLLEDALKVMRAWGFEYKTNMAWIKDKARGKGWFLKSKHELLLIGTRENTPHPAERPASCFEADRGGVHSRKPECAYAMIEAMYPGKKIELFARQARDEWGAWGNEKL